MTNTIIDLTTPQTKVGITLEEALALLLDPKFINLMKDKNISDEAIALDLITDFLCKKASQ